MGLLKPIFTPTTPNTVPSLNFEQTTPSYVWIVDHNLNRFPSVEVIDGDGDVVFGEVHHDSKNRVVITFSHAIVGTVAVR
jgi:hypothetical protein